jgi:exonuclease III
MKGKESLLEMQQLWRTSTGATISARGASGGICTLWNLEIFQLDKSHEATHWLMVKLVHLPSGKIFPIINVYMPNNYWEKAECWESLLGIRDIGFHQNCIIVGDFNTTMHLSEKGGGSIVIYPSRENMEDLVSTLDLFDVQPSKGKFSWSNKRAGSGHIATKLDCFLIHSPLLSLLDEISSLIIPWGSSDHRPISLSFSKEENLGPIPF